MRPFLFAVLLALTAAPAMAQRPRLAPSGHDAVTHMDFLDADEVQGEPTSAAGIRIVGRRAMPRHSLIRPRTTFVPEALKSVERL